MEQPALHDKGTAIDSFLVKGIQRKQGRSVVFSVKKQFRFLKFFSGREDSLVDSMQDRMRGESRRESWWCCGPLIQSEGKEEAFSKHLEVSGSQTLVPHEVLYSLTFLTSPGSATNWDACREDNY